MENKHEQTTRPPSRHEVLLKSRIPQQPQSHGSHLSTKRTGAPEHSYQAGKVPASVKVPGNRIPGVNHVRRQPEVSQADISSTDSDNFTTASNVKEHDSPPYKHQTLQGNQNKERVTSNSCDKGDSRSFRPSPNPYLAPHIRKRLVVTHASPPHPKSGQGQASANDPSPISAEHRPKPKRSKLSQEIKITPLNTLCSSKTPQGTSLGNEVATPVTMITSDESGVVMFRGGNKASTGAKPIPQGTPKKDTPQRIPGPQTTQVGNKGANTAQRNVGKESNKSNKGNTSTGNDPSPSKSAGPSKEEVMEELNRLRAEIVQRAHLNRFKDLDYPTANPEILKRCRNGPGCDPNSNFFLSITKCRLAPIQSADISSATAGQFSHGYEALKTSPSYPQDPTVQWKEYEDSPAMYPIVRNGELSLSPDPIDEHEHIPEMLARSGLQTGAVNQYTGSTQEQKHSWTDAFYADWEYRPQACSSYEAFRDWFRRWLDTTIHICCYADIYHRAFFDGTAHPDGVRTMFIPDLESSTTFLSMDDEESRFHGQETVEGYCFNWEIHAKKDRDEEQFRRKIQRDHYLEGLKKFPLPRASVLKANVYFRPVEVGDVPGLIEIFNYYGLNSPLSTHIKALEAGDIRQIIDDSNEEKLPFIVAAERRVGAIANSGREKIFGYALATDFLGQGTSGRFTAELEIFVKPGHMRKGIGKCLIDKILEVCDATYIPKRGYFFDSNWDDRSGYWAGGRRRLGRLIFAISYPTDRSSIRTYSWIEEWLKRDYGFKEQGRLQGARVKFGKFLNVAYLVRNVGYHGNDRFES